jgi:hypothetical protein
MIRQGLIGSPVLYLNRDPDSSPGGELVFGGVNDDYYTGDFTHVPIDNSGQWRFTMNGVAVRKQTPVYCVDSCDAIVDTGTTYILGPIQAYHLSGFRVCCPVGRRDLKPDYRMSGFRSNNLIKDIF